MDISWPGGKPPTFEDLDSWLTSLGIVRKNDRLQLIFQTIKDWGSDAPVIRWNGRPIPRDQVDRVDLLNATIEVQELLSVCVAFRSTNSDVLRQKLTLALSGHAIPFTETVKNNLPRNTMFELSLASDWARLGIEVQLGDPDITARIGGVPFCVECKRPFREDSIRANLRGAAEQLRTKLENTEAQGAYGIIAISVSRIFNEGRASFVNIPEFKAHGAGPLLERFWDNHRGHIKAVAVHPRIVAVLLHLRMPLVTALNEATGYVAQTLVPVGRRGPVFNFLEQKITSLLRMADST